MKKLLIVLAMAGTSIFGACNPETHNATVEQSSTSINGRDIYIYTIDSCEYMGKFTSGNSDSDILTHKGNCKFCAKRR